MGGQHDTHKHQIAVKFHHRVWRRIEIAAAARNETPGEFIRSVVSSAVDTIPLTADDAQLIADRMKRAEELGRMI